MEGSVDLDTAVRGAAMGARRIFSGGGQIKGLGTKVPQWGPGMGSVDKAP